MAAMAEFKDIKTHFIELPGFGQTPPPDEVWDIDDYKNYVLKEIERADLKNFYLIGHSFGGGIALKIALQIPEKIVGLILISPAIIRRSGLKKKIFFVLTKGGNLIFSLPILSIFRELVRKIAYYISGARDYYVAEGIMKEVFKKIVSVNLLPLVQKIKIKTYLIWGEKDKMTPIKDAFLIKKNISACEFIPLKDIGHSPYLEAPEKLADVVEKIILDNS